MSQSTVQLARPTVQIGSRGDAVRVMQRELIARGYGPGRDGADGYFGPDTLRALRNYQADRSAGQFWAFSYPLVVDGICGPETWGRLGPDTIRSGSRGRMVTLLQNILGAIGVTTPPPEADGVFGAKTEAAVKDFQEFAGLPADGVVGCLTWRALRS
jgi:peptidoglycan hydrolase-like protein with peptidoglycan-binding domain